MAKAKNDKQEPLSQIIRGKEVQKKKEKVKKKKGKRTFVEKNEFNADHSSALQKGGKKKKKKKKCGSTTSFFFFRAPRCTQTKTKKAPLKKNEKKEKIKS